MRWGVVLACAAFACAGGACLFPNLAGLDDAAADASQETSASDVATEMPVADAGADVKAACPAPEPNLVCYYKLDEGAGLAVHDCSGNGRDGLMIAGTAANWSPGHGDSGTAIHIDPSTTTGCVSIGSFPIVTGALSVAVWVKASSYPPDGGN